mgnify:CR=1 FL=1
MNKNKNKILKIILGSSTGLIIMAIIIIVPILMLLDFFGANITNGYVENNSDYAEMYQGVPERGYSDIIANMLTSKNITLLCGVDGKSFTKSNDIAKKIVYTGCIDDYFDYEYGELEYRSLKFDTTIMPVENYQGVAVVNYSDKDVAYTRSIEHKHFLGQKSDVTVITREFPKSYDRMVDIPYYPVESQSNEDKYQQYLEYVPSDMIFAGRLGSYKYTSMDETVENALALAEKLRKEKLWKQ